jgi:hypothetical protein
VQWLALGALGVLFAAAPAWAETCGDADASGAVTVTDGVQALRSAAGLSTGCTPARCDVDGSWSVTVADGVNVLRKAAGLSAPSACPGGTSGDGVQVAVDSVVPFLAFGLQFVSDVGLAGGAVAPAGESARHLRAPADRFPGDESDHDGRSDGHVRRRPRQPVHGESLDG